MEKNILLEQWELPPFDRIDIKDYPPAIRQALAEARQNIEAIATNPLSPTFENTIVALETASLHLDRIYAVMTNLNECCTCEELQATVMELDPEITRFNTEVRTDRRLYKRVMSVKRQYDKETGSNPTGQDSIPTLTQEQQTLLQNTVKGFERHGVGLEGEASEQYKRNQEELGKLSLKFAQNALADENGWTLHLTDEADLDGLKEELRHAAREEAEAKGLEGWLFTLAQPHYIPFMTYSTRRDLRERMYRAYESTGGRGNENDNNAIIRRIVELRAEQAHLLGYDTYCDYILEDRMAQSLPALRRFMQDLHDAVRPAAQSDLEALQSLATQEGIDGKVMPWDYNFLAEKLRQQLYDFDSEALRPYFPLEAVRNGIFSLYGKLYGLLFTEDSSVPIYHPDVKVYRVTDGDRPIGLLYLDLHPRPSKRSGAWMTEFRGQYGNVRPQIQVVCNFSKPTTDTPALLTFNEVHTFMHEMGHAVHGLLSDVQYESLSGTNVKRDFVEMPSQVMEDWCYEPSFLATFARHWQTGEPLPTEYIDKIRASQNHMAAYLCLRQLNLGMTDIAFHTMQPADAANATWKAEQIEAAAMDNILPRVEGCCIATRFGHIFSGGYASGYYGYKWAEVLDADIFSRFKHDGIFNTLTAQSFRREILSRGGTDHPSILFRNFMGRDPDPKALLRRMQNKAN